MSPGDDQTTSSVRVELAALHDQHDQVHVDGEQQAARSRAASRATSSATTTCTSRASRRSTASPAWFANARHTVDSGASTNTASAAQYGSYPDRYNMQASASYVTGTQAIKVGFQDSWGPYNQNLRANADLYQNYVTNAQRHPGAVDGHAARDAVALAGPAEREPRHLRPGRADVQARHDHARRPLGVHQRAGDRPGRADRPLRQHPGVRRQADADLEELLAAHVDRLRPDRQRQDRASRFGYNRFGVAATTTLASLYDPAAGTVINAAGNNTAPWTDKNGDDIAQGLSRCNFATIPACEINFANIPTNFGVISLAQSGSGPDASVRRSVQRRRHARDDARRVGVGRVVPQRRARTPCERNNVLRPGTYANGTVTNPSYRPVTVFSPIDGTPITMYDTVSAAVDQLGRRTSTPTTRTSSSRTTRSSSTSTRGCRTARGCSAARRPIAPSPTPAAARGDEPELPVTIGGVNYCDQTEQRHPVAHAVQARRHVPAALVRHSGRRRRSRRCPATCSARRR